MKFRAIAMIILHLITGVRITLLKETDIKEEYVSFLTAKQLIEKISHRFRRLIKSNQILDKIKNAEN